MTTKHTPGPCPVCNGTYTVDICPTHAAAQRMLEALERIANHESRADRRHRGMVDASELADLQRIARAAIKAARGSEDVERGTPTKPTPIRLTTAQQIELAMAARDPRRASWCPPGLRRGGRDAAKWFGTMRVLAGLGLFRHQPGRDVAYLTDEGLALARTYADLLLPRETER